MSLDLTKVASQIHSMVDRLREESRERKNRIEQALSTLKHNTDDFTSLKRKIASSKTTWLVADPIERPDCHYASPPIPPEYTVIATDGSSIDTDRHRPARCYLINIGSVVLHYGSEPNATLDNLPHLCSGDEELIISGDRQREQPVEGPLLAIKRGVDECRQLANLATSLPAGSSNLALLDGSLILWSLEAYPEFVTQALLHKGFLSYLEEMRKLNSDRRLGLASYISFPRSTDVINMLRVALCPDNPADCDRCSSAAPRACDAVDGVLDRQLFNQLLKPGERSAIFVSPSQVQRYYGVHRVHFFYLNVDNEIARVEIPQWVVNEKNLLDMVHGLVLDQCQRGGSYPVALSEAHEQAVITGADRENFWQLVESSMLNEKMPILSSAKSASKRTRWV